MQLQRKCLKPPTESELELASNWSRTSRLMLESIWLRMDFDPKEIKNPKERYAPLKWLLNDERATYIRSETEPGTARDFRRFRRTKYSELLKQLQADLNASFRERISDMERGGCWRGYAALASQSLGAQLCVGILRTASLLHLLHLPGPNDLAILACDLVNYSVLDGLSGLRVVPIRQNIS